MNLVQQLTDIRCVGIDSDIDDDSYAVCQYYGDSGDLCELEGEGKCYDDGNYWGNELCYAPPFFCTRHYFSIMEDGCDEFYEVTE